jgi:hypothetical protein
MGFASVIGGGLALALLEVAVSSDGTKNAGGLIAGLASIVDRFVSPSVPLIPDLRTSGTTSSSATASGGAETVSGAAPGLSQSVPVPSAPTGSATYANV